MKTMILAAAVLTLGLGSAYADSHGGVPGNTFFTNLPGVTAKPATGSATSATTTQTPDGRPIQLYPSQSRTGTWLYQPENAPAGATTPNGPGVRAYVTQSSHGTWLYSGSHGGDGTQG